MLMNKMRPSIYLSTIVWVWGTIVLAMSQAKSFNGFLVARFFLGTIEAGLFPGAIFLLTCWYTKREIGKFKACDLDPYCFSEPCVRGLLTVYLSGL
jgi:MFS family permease